MKYKFTVLIILLFFSLLPIIHFDGIAQQEITIPPAPDFISLNNTGTSDGNLLYSVNTAIKIRYQADRFQVDGLFLVGFGSNLTEDIGNFDLLMNFTKVESFRGDSFYEVDLNLTSYTYFYAYSWFGSFANNSKEEIDLLGERPGHELWISSEKLFPDFIEREITAPLRDDSYYVELGTKIELTYRVRNPNNETNDAIYVAYGNNETDVLNSTLKILTVLINKTDYGEFGKFNFSVFKFNYTLDRAVVYFAAFNERGWERESPEIPLVHKITNGFSFNSTIKDLVGDVSDIDSVNFTLTTYNETNNMNAAYRYRYFANSSVDTPLVNWTEMTSLVSSNSSLVNSSRDGEVRINSTLVTIYDILINETFDPDNLIEIETFIEYFIPGREISGGIQKIEVLSSKPILSISSANNTITNKINSTIFFSFSTQKGKIDSAELTHLLPSNTTKSSSNIKSKQNSTVVFTFELNNTIYQGVHTIIINVTNSLGKSTSQIILFFIDTTPPTGTVSLINPSGDDVSVTGDVSVDFSFADEGLFDNGVKFAYLDWGNNVEINATDLSKADFRYRRSGAYTITLRVIDLAGNEFSTTTQVTVNLIETPTTTQNRRNPINVSYFIFGLIVLYILSHKRKRISAKKNKVIQLY